MELIEKGDKKTLLKVREAAEQMLEGMKLSLQRLKVEADSYFHESNLIASSKFIGLQGALWVVMYQRIASAPSLLK